MTITVRCLAITAALALLPAAGAETFWESPVGGGFHHRRDIYFEMAALTPPADVFTAMTHLAVNQRVNASAFHDACRFVNERNDCADFRLHGLLRFLYQFRSHPLADAAVVNDVQQTVLDFKYWPDEPGIDSMCSWSENHYILFASAGYLAGQLYPAEIFSNTGETGAQKMARNRDRILTWLTLRYRTGFSEWLSNVYYDEDLLALLNLVDFCADPELAERAAMVTDLIFLDMALNSFRGVFGSTHGRSYERHKKRAEADSTSTVSWLAFGTGQPRVGSMSGTSLALSQGYEMPVVLSAVMDAAATSTSVTKQRMGIRLDEAERWGLGFDSFENGMHLLTLEAYTHPRVIDLTMDMFDAWNWWDNDFFAPFAEHRELIATARGAGLMPLLARRYRQDLGRNIREEVNIYTYRTPDYMLSTAQDYRKGYGGDQQHIWQATLGPNAVCFTTHPSKRGMKSPDYWTGSGSLPRAAQVENVAIVIYDILFRPGLYVTNKLNFTHAWLPRDQFDEVVEQNAWIFARKGDAFLALRSQQPYEWAVDGDSAEANEVIAPGEKNVWVCELGSVSVNGPFEEFTRRIAGATMAFRDRGVRYDSPSQGTLDFGWRGPLRQNGKRVNLNDYPRYDSPYVTADFPGSTVEVRSGTEDLKLDWTTRTRHTGSRRN